VPETVQRVFEQQPFVALWYSGPVFLSLLLALALTVWLFVDALRSGQEAWTWKALVMIASMFSGPAVLLLLLAPIAIVLSNALLLLAVFNMAGGILAIVAAVGYLATKRRPSRCPVCNQPQEPGWSQCPYHPPPAAADSGRPSSADPALDAGVPAETTLYDLPDLSLPPPSGTLYDLPAVAAPTAAGKGSTVILRKAPQALGLLMIQFGPNAGSRLALNDGVTRIGRDGRLNQHVLDDAAVSDLHLSIRHRTGTFTLTDLDTATGTSVNGKPVHKCTLDANDLIHIGNTRLVFIRLPGSAEENH
jgi:pSer/pThr/pTyr-binding forkhead associated (FHA) protein